MKQKGSLKGAARRRHVATLQMKTKREDFGMVPWVAEKTLYRSLHVGNAGLRSLSSGRPLRAGPVGSHLPTTATILMGSASPASPQGHEKLVAHARHHPHRLSRQRQ